MPKSTVAVSQQVEITNCTGFRGLEQVTGVYQTTVIYWVKQVGQRLPDAYDPEGVPQVGELDELEPFVELKNKI
jgi:hypothetical protein